MVGANGFEPSTSWSRTRRASQAALRPEILKTTANSLSRITIDRNQWYRAVLQYRGTRALDTTSLQRSPRGLDCVGKASPTDLSSCAVAWGAFTKAVSHRRNYVGFEVSRCPGSLFQLRDCFCKRARPNAIESAAANTIASVSSS